MGIQLYFTRLKCLFRNKESMFWSYLFPIILATCFFFAFNNLWKIEDFETIPIAYDKGGAMDDQLAKVLVEAENTNQVKLFDLTYCTEEQAEKLLEDGTIDAYIVGSEDPVLYVKDNGLNETIIKAFLDLYRQKSQVIQTILQKNPNAMQQGLLEDIMKEAGFLEEIKSDKKPAEILVYFYALLAYTCIFASNWGLDEVVNIQADLSGRGARVSVSPTRKLKLFLCNMLAAFTVHMGSIILLFVYMYYFMKIDFGNNLFYLLILCFIGSLAGLGLGAAVGVWVRKKAEVKEAILLAVTLGGAFLSGMMIPAIKYMVAENVPILGYINPVNVITDGMYSLYFYDTYDRYYMNLAILIGITIAFVILAFLGIRRKSYASI